MCWLLYHKRHSQLANQPSASLHIQQQRFFTNCVEPKPKIPHNRFSSQHVLTHHLKRCTYRQPEWRFIDASTPTVLTVSKLKKGKGFRYSTLSAGPGADSGVQAVSLQVTVSHPPGGRLPLLSARPAVTSPATEHHRPLASTKLYCLLTEAHRCKQLAQGCCAALPRAGFEPTDRKLKCLTVAPPCHLSKL